MNRIATRSTSNANAMAYGQVTFAGRVVVEMGLDLPAAHPLAGWSKRQSRLRPC